MSVRIGTAIVVVALLGSARADGAPARAVVVSTGEEPACVSPASLASALARHAPWPVQVVTEPPAADAEVVAVTLRAAGERIEVELSHRGWTNRQSLDPPPCDAAPDVVAALVASTLAPEPLADPDTPMPSLDAIADDVTSALTAQGVALAGEIVITRGADGWIVELVGEACRGRRVIDELPPSPDRRVARLAAVVAALLADCPRPVSPTIDRAVAAAQSIDDYSRGAWLRRQSGLLEAGVGVTALALWGASANESNSIDEPDYFYLAGAAIAVGGGLVGWSRRDHDDGDTIVGLSTGVALSVATMGLAFELPRLYNDGDDDFFEAWIVVGASGLLSSGWFAIDRLRSPPIGLGRLAELRRRVATPERRARLSSHELVEIERELRRWRPPGSGLRYALPLFAGTAVLLAMAAGEEESDERESNLFAAAVLLVDALIVTAIHSPGGSHEDRSRGLGLDVGVAPIRGGAALGVRGSW